MAGDEERQEKLPPPRRPANYPPEYVRRAIPSMGGTVPYTLLVLDDDEEVILVLL